MYRLPSGIRSLLQTAPTVAPVPHRSLLRISGSHAPEFLNGILSNKIDRYNPFFAAFLNPQGRVLFDIFLYTSVDAAGKLQFILEHDSRSYDGIPIQDLIKRYILRAKVKLRDASHEFDVWQAWNSPQDTWDSERHWLKADSGAIEQVWANAAEDWPLGNSHERIQDRRAVGMGNRILVPKGEQLTLPGYEVAPENAYTLHRILHGVPEGFTDIQPVYSFPMDSNLDIMGGVDFRKGCYVGQELTVRTYHKGVVRKRILPVIISPQTNKFELSLPTTITFPTGIDIGVVVQAEGPRPRGTGKLLTNVGGVGLALMRLEQVEGVEQGRYTFELNDKNNGKWNIRHWWPDWWPTS